MIQLPSPDNVYQIHENYLHNILVLNAMLSTQPCLIKDKLCPGMKGKNKG